jgi:hypothetical protein
MREYDPVAFGRVEEKVDHLGEKVDKLSDKVDKLIEERAQRQGLGKIASTLLSLFSGGAGAIVALLAQRVMP